MFSVMIEVGWCGFGAHGGLVPELRAGLLRLAFCRGSLLARVRQWNAALHAAATLGGAFPAESNAGRSGIANVPKRGG
jgi:hypothetical protein